ncbi:hypothetical protein EL26_04645 [Tumebacillus flagellatus]|uniref:ATPase dynein-related AAA domain-containing protein n=1 Tax=Tumebacillus flagellatus TaxID=1157490 RepID=A0A074LQH3_9BACL|nr:hypothetical protein [Tumebacillus flagellatus]KEO84396.1 hypothetical protein EL26_04645 [Tumebacillus flagellatus]
MKVWKIAPGRYAANWKEAKEKGIIFIGWDEMGDLRQYKTREDLVEKYQDVYDVDYNPINNSFTLWAFTNLIQEGDVIIANKGGRAIVGIGKVTGDYEYRPDLNPDYPNVRKVDWALQQEVTLSKKLFPNKTLSEVSEDRVAAIQQGVLKKIPNAESMWSTLGLTNSVGEQNSSSSTHEQWVDFCDEFLEFAQSRHYYFEKSIIERFVTSLRSKPFLILSGISGTGKTKIAQLFAEFMSQPRSQTSRLSEKNSKSFEVVLQPYMFDHSRMILSEEVVKQVDRDFARGETVTAFFGEFIEHQFIKEQGNGVRFGFRKGLTAWLHDHFDVGKILRFRVSNDGKLWEFGDVAELKTSMPPQTAFLSVRPDWLDHRGLLGGYNPMTEKYQVTEMLKVLLRAQSAPEHPFFVVLDEMNLAKVEYYFSDFLSCLESRRMKDGKLVQEAIQLHQADADTAQGLSFVDDDGTVYQIPPSIEIPQNLYFIGTVNVDETTYMFSPKVLDRAHVIEFNDVDFEAYRKNVMGSSNQGYNPSWNYDELVADFTANGNFHKKLYAKEFLRSDDPIRLQSVFELVDSLKEKLLAEGYSFGYRVFDEGMTFIDNLLELEMKPESAFDLMMLQKVFPKFHGNRAQMEQVLSSLFNFCLFDSKHEEVEEDEEEAQGENKKKKEKARATENAIHADFKGDFLTGFRFPKSAEKLHSMYRQLERAGYCSFIQ